MYHPIAEKNLLESVKSLVYQGNTALILDLYSVATVEQNN